MRNFFVIAPLYFEDITLDELKLLYPEHPLDNFQVVRGGIEIKNLPLEAGFRANYFLKSAVRVLLRLMEGKCRDYPRFFQKCSKIAWNQYLFSHDTFKLHFSTHASRLFDSRKVEKAISDAIKSSFRHQAPKQKTESTCKDIFVRVENDHLTLSIDTSGEELFIRGHRPQTSLAPLRENLAYCLIQRSLKVLKQQNIQTLISPMMGQATFLLEAATFNTLNTKRSFVFEKFPCYKKETPSVSSSFPLRHSSWQHFLGIEKDPKTYLLAEKNCESFSSMQLVCGDYFEWRPKNIPLPALALINPPYGKRIKIAEGPLPLYNQMITHHRKNFPGIPLGMLIPQGLIKKMKNFNFVFSQEFFNGGIDLEFILWDS